MLSRVEHLMHFSTTPRAQARPPWLPPELISHILTFLTGEDLSHVNGSISNLARVCRCWYQPVMSYVYGNASPASYQSCELLIRSLDNDPQLSFLIKSLTIPRDPHLLTFDNFNVRDPSLLRNLVAKCPHLIKFRIPMHSSLMWTNELLQVKLPSMKQLSNLRSLEISAFMTTDPGLTHRDIAAEYVSMWLNQVSSLPLLEHLSLFGVAFSAGPSLWPSLPNLRSLWLHRPWCSSGETISLLSQVRGSLKILRVTGPFESQVWSRGPYDFHNRFKLTLISAQIVASTLEELTIISREPINGFLLDIQWHSQGLSQILSLLPHMSSLRRLHISSRIYHPLLLTKAPPLLDTLVITMHSGDQESELGIRGLLRLLSHTSINNLIINIKGYLSEKIYLNGFIARSISYPDSIDRSKRLEHEIHQLAQELGINFRIERQTGSTFCVSKPRSESKGRLKFLARLRSSS